MEDIVTRATSIGHQAFQAPRASTVGAMAGLGALDPGRTALYVGGVTLGSATLPLAIAGVLYAFKNKKAAKTALIVAGVFAAVGASSAVFTATKFNEEFKGEL